ncbi:MAG: sigma-70 family RNA polymerase sigma factor [Gemmataceae bacterium]
MQHAEASGAASGTCAEPDLLRLYLAGRDPAAFEAIVRRYGPVVHGVCRRMLRNEEDVQDAFQNTFLLLVRRADTLQHPELVGNWLYGVACRTCQNLQRGRARRQAREHHGDTELIAAPEEENVEQAELHGLLHCEIRELPDKYRAPLVMCDLLGKTHEETARSLSWPLGSLAKRLARARDLLRQRMEARGVALSVAALAVLLAEEAKAALPEALVSATLASASGATAATAAAVGEAGAALAEAEAAVEVAALVEAELAGAVIAEASAAAATSASASAIPWTMLLSTKFLAAGTLVLAIGVFGAAAMMDRLLPPSPERAAAHGKVFWADVPAGADAQKVGPDQPVGQNVDVDKPVAQLPPAPLPEPLNQPAPMPDPPMPDPPMPVVPPDRMPERGGAGLFAGAKITFGNGPPATLGVERITARDGSSFSKEAFGLWYRGAPGGYWGTGDLSVGGFNVRPSWTLAFSPDSKRLAVGGNAGHVALYHLSAKELPKTIGGLPYSPSALAFTPEGKSLFIASASPGLKGLDLGGDKLWSIDTGSVVYQVAVTADGRRLVCLEGDATGLQTVVRVRDLAGKPAGWQQAARFMALSPRGDIVALWNENQAISLREVATGKELVRLALKNSYGCGAFSPDGRLLATACSDKVIRIFDVATGRETQRLKGVNGYILFVTFAPDGKQLVSGGMEPCVRAWDTATGQLIGKFDDNNWYFDGQFSPDGKALAITGFDRVHVWFR